MGSINAEKKAAEPHFPQVYFKSFFRTGTTVLCSLALKTCMRAERKERRTSRAILYIPWCLRIPEYTSGRESVTHITSPRDHPDDVTYVRREYSVFLRPGEGDPRPCYVVPPVEKVIEWVYFLSKVYRTVNVNRKTRENITELGWICQCLTLTSIKQVRRNLYFFGARRL